MWKFWKKKQKRVYTIADLPAGWKLEQNGFGELKATIVNDEFVNDELKEMMAVFCNVPYIYSSFGMNDLIEQILNQYENIERYKKSIDWKPLN